MANTSLLSKPTHTNKSTTLVHESCISAKLRRLKIEENIMLQSLHKLDRDLGNDSNAFAEFRVFVKKHKNYLDEMKKMFLDAKTTVSSQEMLKSIDVEEIRGNIIELDNSIKAFKGSIQTELAALRSAIHQLNYDVNEDPINIYKIKKYSKVQTLKYTQLVPSPVRLLMNSPFKCLEVQEFQDFMKNSQNRYGGWNEYNHNIFITFWHKYFGSDTISYMEKNNTLILDSPNFQAFLEDVSPKLQGVVAQDIISHFKWYSKYVTLKDRQQDAIAKWRLNREIIKKSSKASQNIKQTSTINNSENYAKTKNKRLNNDTISDLSVTENCRGSINHKRNFIRKCFIMETMQDKRVISPEKSLNKNAMPHSLRPTEQWITRCNQISKNKESFNHAMDLELITKLATPKWRIELQKFMTEI